MKHTYSLRRKERIEKEVGSELLKRIITSLDERFKNDKSIESDLEEIESEPYPILIIEDCGHTVNVILFYVIRKTFNNYQLAFKEFLG